MRFLRYTLIILVILLVGLPVMAQEQTPPAPLPTDDIPAESVSVDEAQAILNEAQNALQEARNTNNFAFGLFNVLGAVGTLVALVIAIAGGYVVLELRKTQNARQEFNKFTNELKQQSEQRVNSILALSMMPLAHSQYKAQDYKGAINTYLKALELDANNAFIHYRLGYVYTQQGELANGKNYIDKALSLYPDFTQALAAQAYLYRRMGEADKANQQRLYALAEAMFWKVLSDFPTLVDEDGESWWGALGGLYYRQNRYDEAISAYEKAHDVTKTSSYPLGNLGMLYVKTRNGLNAEILNIFAELERIAQSEVRADVNNFWAYTDVVKARVAQSTVEIDDAYLGTSLQLASSAYHFQSMINPLKELLGYVPESSQGKLQQIIQKIETAMIEWQNAQKTQPKIEPDDHEYARQLENLYHLKDNQPSEDLLNDIATIESLLKKRQ